MASEQTEIFDRQRLVEQIGTCAEAIELFYKRLNVCELAFFGSILRDGFGPDSDINMQMFADSWDYCRPQLKGAHLAESKM